jgi:hypothetical protein
MRDGREFIACFHRGSYVKCVESIGCPQSVVGEAIKGCESIGCSPLKCLPSFFGSVADDLRDACQQRSERCSVAFEACAGDASASPCGCRRDLGACVVAACGTSSARALSTDECAIAL